MDWMQFVSSLVSSLAWPLAAVMIVFFFRKSLASRFASLLSLSLPGGVEAKFSEKLISVEQAVIESVPPTSPALEATSAPPTPADQTLRSKLSDLAVFSASQLDQRALKANPTGVVMEGWKLLDTELRAMHAKYVGITAHVLPAQTIMKDLAERKFLSHDEVKTIREMLNMRNLAAHSTEAISPESASAFAELAERLAHTFATRLPALPSAEN